MRNVALEAGEQVSPEFLAINPNGVVPVLIHNGKIITESTIILEYLDDAFLQPPLMPADPYWRARRRAWARWIDEEMHIPHIAVISFVVAFNHAFRQQFDTQEKLDAYIDKIPDAKLKSTQQESFSAGLDSERMRISLRAYDHFLDAMDATLAEVPWLAGDAFSLADIDVVPYIWRLRNLQLAGMWATRPRIQDWLDRVSGRASFRTGVIDCALPEWIELMAATGREAWPVVRKLLA
jgi:glutathione S-transferase